MRAGKENYLYISVMKVEKGRKFTQEEIDYLYWFWHNAPDHFGPAESDVMYLLDNKYSKDMKVDVPKGWAQNE